MQRQTHRNRSLQGWRLAVAGGMLLAAAIGVQAQAPSAPTVCLLAPSDASVAFSRQYTWPELARLGFRDGENLRIVVRVASGQPTELPRLAAELSGQRCAVVVAVGASAITTAREAMSGTPIVMGFGDDPVGRGWAESLQRPGGWITGVSMQASEADLKRIELLRGLLPRARRLGVLLDPAVQPRQQRALQDTARRLGFAVATAEAARPADFERAFAALRQARVDAVLITSHPVYLTHVDQLVRWAQASGLPAMCEWTEMARAGCLASFGPVIGELRTRVGAIVAQILRGTPPADIPIEQPVRLQLALNLKVAAALGVAIPPALRSRADEAYE